MPTPVLCRSLNLERVMDVLYREGDGYTHVGKAAKGGESCIVACSFTWLHMSPAATAVQAFCIFTCSGWCRRGWAGNVGRVVHGKFWFHVSGNVRKNLYKCEKRRVKFEAKFERKKVEVHPTTFDTHEVSQRWHTEQRCSYQHVGETFEPEQNWHQSPNNGVMDLNIEWSTWESRTEPIRPVVGSSSSSNPWEEPIYNYPTVGETTYQHTQVSSSEPRNVFEQPHVQTNFGASSSSYACHDDDVYRPQFDYPQPSTYGQSMCVDSVTCWLSTTTISTPSFAQDMYSTPPPMQTMDDQLNQDEQTPDLLHQRRIVNPPRRYDQTSSLHRQVLPRRKG
ncbi:hypothetical protein V6N12_014492 [Hibiscus sabdariffa]|uniref:Uncharacterized protein n=1 Tax=Hibiscus sabdariffa TaxID=183260 RepID=A0ABR2DKB8_9ROSI